MPGEHCPENTSAAERIEEIKQIHNAFTAWFQSHTQFLTFLLLSYFTALGLAFNYKTSALFLVAALLLVLGYIEEIRLRHFIAPFVYRALEVAPRESALGLFVRTVYEPTTLDQLQATQGESDETIKIAKLKDALTWHFVRLSKFSYLPALIVTLLLIIFCRFTPTDPTAVGLTSKAAAVSPSPLITPTVVYQTPPSTPTPIAVSVTPSTLAIPSAASRQSVTTPVGVHPGNRPVPAASP